MVSNKKAQLTCHHGQFLLKISEEVHGWPIEQSVCWWSKWPYQGQATSATDICLMSKLCRTMVISCSHVIRETKFCSNFRSRLYPTFPREGVKVWPTLCPFYPGLVDHKQLSISRKGTKNNLHPTETMAPRETPKGYELSPQLAIPKRGNSWSSFLSLGARQGRKEGY